MEIDIYQNLNLSDDSFTFWEKKGYIVVRNKKITFIDLKQLEALLEPKN